MPRCISYRAILPRRRGRPVLSVVSWPSSRGHSSRRTSPTSLYLDAARKRANKKKGRREERGELRFPSLLQMSRAVLRSFSCFCGCSRKLFLRHINSRWRAAKCERRSRDNGHDDARLVLHSSSSGTSLHQSVHHSSSLLRVFIRLERVSEAAHTKLHWHMVRRIRLFTGIFIGIPFFLKMIL